MSKKSIKETYSDVLFWVTSPMSKDKRYHITYAQESVLRKLIHYTNKGVKRFINYSNESISSHIYMSEEHLKKIIPKLNKVGYIIISSRKHNNNGEFKTSRTIEIDWNFIESIVPDLPKVKSKTKIEEVTIDSNEEIEVESQIEEVTIDSNEEIEVESQNELEDLENCFRPDDEVNLFEILPILGFNQDDINYIVESINEFSLNFGELELKLMELESVKTFPNSSSIKFRPDLLQKIEFIKSN